MNGLTALREPTADELAILRHFRAGANARITSFSTSYSDGELPDIPDETYLKASILAYSTRGAWEATFWATKAGRALANNRLSAAHDDGGEG